MRSFLIFLFLVFTASVCSAETIKLKSGKVVEGKIVEQTADYIKVDTGIGVNLTYYKDDIDSASGNIPKEHTSEITKLTLMPTLSAKPNFEVLKKNSVSAEDINNFVKESDSFVNSVDKAQTLEIFYDGEKEIARISTDFEGNVVVQSGTIPDGIVKEYDENGKLKDEVTYEKNQPTGKRIAYYPDATVAGYVNYVDGKMNGEFKAYHKNGKVNMEGSYQAGKPVGGIRMYDENGNLIPGTGSAQ